MVELYNSVEVNIIKIDDIIPNVNQPRKYINDKSLNELATSIKNYGIINPIIVRKKNDKYEIISGERRYQAAKKINLKEIPAIVKNVDDQQMKEIALAENLSREELNPLEEAKAYQEIIKTGNYTKEDLNKKTGASTVAIEKKLQLLTLPMEVQKAIIEQKISERHARSLLKLDSDDEKIKLLKEIIDNKLTIKETEYIIKEIKKMKKEEKDDKKMNSENLIQNFDNTPNMGNVSLNTMNFESMNQTIPTPQSNMINQQVPPTAPEFNQPIPSMQQQGIVSNQPSAMSSPVMPNFQQPQQPVNEQQIVPPMPEFVTSPINSNQNIMEQVQPVDEQRINNSMPEIEVPFLTPTQNPINSNPTLEQPQQFKEEMPPIIDVPLFNQNLNQNIPDNTTSNEVPVNNQENKQIIPESIPNINETFYEVPSNISPIIEPTPARDKFKETKDFLDSNSIPYKAYSSESGSCIIIEF